MRKFTQLISCASAMILFFAVSATAQTHPIDPAVEVVVIENLGEVGVIERVINGDTLVGGIRANPTRIYELEAGNPYVMAAPIRFGGAQDSTSLLTIVGQTGGKKPMIWHTPADNGDAFRHRVIGSLKVKNLYWPTLTTTGKATVLFELQGTNQRLELEDFIHENQLSGDVVSLGGVSGTMDIFLKNCYFRDMTKFTNPWNYAIFTRGDHNAIDTLWMENVTVANGGLLVMNKYCVVNFAFFNHNTIQNIPRYWNFMENWKEAYFTNNLFINCLWMGEMPETMLSQLQSQTELGPSHPETMGVEVGLINLMRPESATSTADWITGFGAAPTIDDVKFLASNNLAFTSPFLDNYYAGGLNDTTAFPVSYTDWNNATGQGWDGPPHEVGNNPTRMFSAITDTLIADYAGIIASDNHWEVDPGMVTKMVRDQNHGDSLGTWSQSNYSWDGITVPDKLNFTIGDYDPLTIPGSNVEDSDGMTTVMDMPEDFTYTGSILSTIDFRKLGAQEWYKTIDNWDSEAELVKAKHFYDTGEGTPLDPTGVEEQKLSASVSIYPNPSTGQLNLDSDSELSAAKFFDVTGRMVKQINLNGEFNRTLDVSELRNGIYILQIETVMGVTQSSKFIKE
ncbi:MAG: T9SS type A sorting domain-containing protein [Bacteroidales bacterium]|nr:T9SS type A sorting domain-containing protein [Bacteroidales bacterium]